MKPSMFKYAIITAIFFATMIGNSANAWSINGAKIDSITIDLQSLLSASDYSIQLVLKNDDCFCFWKSFEVSPISNEIESIRDFNDSELSHSLLFSYNYHQVNRKLSSCLFALVDSLFLTRNSNIIDRWWPSDNLIYSFEPSTVINIKIYKKSDNSNIVETFLDEQELSCTYNGIRRHFADNRQYSTTYRDFVVLLHYIAIHEGIDFSNNSEIKDYITHHFTNVNTLPSK